MNWRAARITVLFGILVPWITFGLLEFKGLPPFTAGHALDVITWVFQVTFAPSLISGILFSLVLAGGRRWLRFFIEPFDFGRCFSMGAIAGSLLEALSTWSYRALTHHPFSSFWIAGAVIAGGLTGAAVGAFELWVISRKPRRK